MKPAHRIEQALDYLELVPRGTITIEQDVFKEFFRGRKGNLPFQIAEWAAANRLACRKPTETAWEFRKATSTGLQT